MRKVIVGLVAAVVLAGQASGAEPPGELLSAKTIRCTVDKGVYTEPGQWGTVSPDPWRKGNVARFDAIDPKTGRARIKRNAGGGDVILMATKQGLHFIERAPSGNVVLRTVFAGPVGPRRYRYVASRHINLISGPLPSQYYGTCVVLDWR